MGNTKVRCVCSRCIEVKTTIHGKLQVGRMVDPKTRRIHEERDDMVQDEEHTRKRKRSNESPSTHQTSSSRFNISEFQQNVPDYRESLILLKSCHPTWNLIRSHREDGMHHRCLATCEERRKPGGCEHGPSIVSSHYICNCRYCGAQPSILWYPVTHPHPEYPQWRSHSLLHLFCWTGTHADTMLPKLFHSLQVGIHACDMPMAVQSEIEAM